LTVLKEFHLPPTCRKSPVYLALGANLPSQYGDPVATLDAALAALERAGVRIEARSPWYASAPVPRSEQPDYVNGVARIATDLTPTELLGLLHRIEAGFGRVRGARNEARAIDLDMIDYAGLVIRSAGEGLELPHPRAHLRGFVLLPLRDVAPEWRHPVTRRSLDELIGELPDANDVRRL
jgi:2-amino-4-hydroxy-6-hydroxymethyldihydropteridine diphosphokinase